MTNLHMNHIGRGRRQREEGGEPIMRNIHVLPVKMEPVEWWWFDRYKDEKWSSTINAIQKWYSIFSLNDHPIKHEEPSQIFSFSFEWFYVWMKNCWNAAGWQIVGLRMHTHNQQYLLICGICRLSGAIRANQTTIPSMNKRKHQTHQIQSSIHYCGSWMAKSLTVMCILWPHVFHANGSLSRSFIQLWLGCFFFFFLNCLLLF